MTCSLGNSSVSDERHMDAAFYAFDIMWLDGADLRSLPLIERKRILRRVVHGHDGILYAAHIERRGVDLYRAICQKDLEGIVAKHRNAPYVTRRATWFKVLNPDYTQKRGRKEMFEGFRDSPDASRVSSHPARA
jgi:ATP-dependent DNA ligase